MDVPPSPSALHRHPSSSSSSVSHRPSISHSRDPTDPDLPTRFRRGSTASTSTGLAGLSREDIEERERLVNEYEAEEERLVNVLGRRMEEMREETTTLHNAMEGEAEALVNKLQRQLQTLQAQLAAQSPSSSPNVATTAAPAAPLPPHGLPSIGSPVLPAGSFSGLLGGGDPLQPSQDKIVEVLRQENDGLRARLSDAERGFIHVCRQNDVYREELIHLRQRLNLPYQDLVLPPPSSPSPSSSSSSFGNNGIHHPVRQYSAASSRSPQLGAVGGRSFTRAGGHRPSASGGSGSFSGIDLSADPSSSSSTSTSALPSPAVSLGPIAGDLYARGTSSPEVERRLSVGGQERPNFRVAERGQLRRAGSTEGPISEGQ